ncbi:hypothetical protein N1027_04260 [Herbiconiux sp. CPCC 205763]|uniref:Integral membrane protein n=1 Tax=Herbiconiux aconitum TaxID=2970913 RepID=A0ABT2GP20_9MICO|nr:hypothetical protein [Herbiconiux aconitum]MCS5717347.1 hypothetical protein [Herbiconiux aconitum]
MSSRGVRVARGLTAAAVAVFVAAFSHAAAGAEAPGAVGVTLAVALSAVVCVVLARRQLSLPALAVSVMTSQFALHLLFGVGAGSASGISLGQTTHHGHVAMTVVTDAATGPAHPGHDSGWMWVGHALAALATIALLHRGERTIRALLGLARARFEAVWSLVRLAFAEPGWVGSHSRAVGLPVIDLLRDLGVLLGSRRHRGPPVAAAAHL